MLSGFALAEFKISFPLFSKLNNNVCRRSAIHPNFNFPKRRKELEKKELKELGGTLERKDLKEFNLEKTKIEIIK